MATTSVPQQTDDVSQSKLLYDLYENLEAEGVGTEGGAPAGGDGGAGSGVAGGGDNSREPMHDNFVPQPPMRQNKEQMGEQMGEGEPEEFIEEYIIEEPEDERSSARKVFDEVKTPMLVFSIFFVISLRFLDRQMAMYLPSTVNDYRRLNVLGILLKAAIAGVLFFVLNRYVLTRF